jgi:LysM repeat protein
VRETLTRRIGPAPVWLWFVVLVIGVVIFLRLRAAKAPTTKASSTVGDSPNLTNQPSALIPWPSDTFVNIQQPGATGPAGPAGPAGPTTTTTTPPPVTTTPPPPPRVTSATYTIKSGDTLTRIANSLHVSLSSLYNLNKATIEAVARQHGLASSGSGHWIWGGTKLVVPS